MSKHYDAPSEVRELEKQLRDFAYNYGANTYTVFRDFLRFVVIQFSVPGTPPNDNWKYTIEQNGKFYQMFCSWVLIMQKQIAIHGWYDAFGDLFMSITSQKAQQVTGQFFTPNDLCELMGRSIIKETNEVISVYDPAAGSGRNLLEAKSINPRTYLEAWDIDYTCCLMSVCNFVINSCVGVVVCINTLTLKDFRGAWIVNEAYYRTGLPSIRWLTEKEYLEYSNTTMWKYLFCDQETFDQTMKYLKIWNQFKTLFNNDQDQRTTDNF